MSKLRNSTNRQIAAQCIMPKLETEKYYSDTSYKAEIVSLIQEGIGGFCLFGGTAEQIYTMINELQNFADIPMIFSADMEYGMPMRFDDGTEFPHAMALAATGDKEYTFKTASAIAEEAKNSGITWNLSPVCDINSNPDNPIINVRSFGENAQVVNEHSAEYIKGTQKHKVLACAKHFPGHGDTNKDSHLELPVLEHSKEKIERLDLLPFINAISQGVRSIMAGHLSIPSLDDSKLPATLSRKIITDLLKSELGYQGLIITDALEMKAIKDNYGAEEAVLMSLKAGCDVALIPDDPFKAIGYIEKEMDKDEELKNNLINSGDKLIKHKRWCGLIPQFAAGIPQPKTFMTNQKTALKIADAAVNYIGDENILPLPEDIVISAFAILSREEDMRAGTRFFTMLAQATENDTDFGFVNENIKDEDMESFKDQTADAQLVIFPVFTNARAYQGTVDLPEKISKFVSEISKGKKSIALIFGNPYIAEKLDVDLAIKAYSDSFASLAAGVVHLTGRRAAVDL